MQYMFWMIHFFKNSFSVCVFCLITLGDNIYQLVGTVEANFTHLVVYTASQLVEQTTPNASAISDTVARRQEMVVIFKCSWVFYADTFMSFLNKYVGGERYMKVMWLIGMMLDLTVNAWVVEVGSHAHFLWNPTWYLFLSKRKDSPEIGASPRKKVSLSSRVSAGAWN